LRRNAETAAVADDPIHVLNPVERAGLRRVSRGAVSRAALAGVVNALLTGLSELLTVHFVGPLSEQATLAAQALYFGVFGALAIFFAVLEILYLGWDGLRSVTRLSAVAGMELSRDENKEVALALARAALELPSPQEAVAGVNPHREASKFQLIVASAVYKLKIFATNFVFKQLLRRVLSPALGRVLLPFAAVPINGLWNGLVCWSVLREARIRVMGPSATQEMLSAVLEGEPEPRAVLVEAIHRAVGSAIVRTRELHPNHVALVRAVRLRLGEPEPLLQLDDSAAFLELLPRLELAERRVALRVLAVAAILDGRLVRGERNLLSEAYRSAELPSGAVHVEALRRAFVAGDIISHVELRRAGA